jgi:multimeric flavodoxin WrbA
LYVREIRAIGVGDRLDLAEEAKAVKGTTVELLRLHDADIQNGRWSNAEVLGKLQGADAIIFGTPTYMGGYSAQMKCFIDACGGIWSWRPFDFTHVFMRLFSPVHHRVEKVGVTTRNRRSTRCHRFHVRTPFIHRRTSISLPDAPSVSRRSAAEKASATPSR